MTQHVAVYVRVSSKRQDLASQLPDLERWAAAQGEPVKYYTDKFTGKPPLVSIKDGIDLATASGRMLANVLASVAQFETELRAERVRAAQAAAKAAGKSIGGRKAGVRVRLTEEKESAVKRLHKSGSSVSEIARTLQLSGPTVYKAIGN